MLVLVKLTKIKFHWVLLITVSIIWLIITISPSSLIINLRFSYGQINLILKILLFIRLNFYFHFFLRKFRGQNWWSLTLLWRFEVLFQSNLDIYGFNERLYCLLGILFKTINLFLLLLYQWINDCLWYTFQ